MAKQVKSRARGEEKEARTREIEDAMARRMPFSQIEAYFMKRWGVSARTVRRYMQDVRTMWAEEAQAEDRVERRTHMRASLNSIYAKAMTRTVVVKDADGKPILDGNGRPLTIESPDTRSAIQAARTLIQLDGLDDPALLRVSVEAKVEHSTTEAGRAALEAFLLGRGAKLE